MAESRKPGARHTRLHRRLTPYAKRWLGALWSKWVRPLAPVVLVVLTFRSAVADWNDVPTGSMEPTVLVGDRILVNKLSYGLRLPFTETWLVRWSEPQRGEIAVLISPESGDRLVKRVIGVPGDTVELKDNRLLVNGQPARYSALPCEKAADIAPGRVADHSLAVETLDGKSHLVMATPGIRARRSFGPVTVPDGFYFVLGDNRDSSRDSRVIGLIPRDKILGRTGRVVLSVDKENCYLPRGDRFLHPVE